jgi:phosphoglycolate phosphatase
VLLVTPTQPAPGSLLLLWDIDHTLIETGGVGGDVYKRVFPAVTGIPLRQLAAVSGRTELDIMHDTLALHGIEPASQMVDQLAQALADGYVAAADELRQRGRALPGAVELLQDFAGQPAILQTVLTGNTAAIARIKLETFGLDPYLDLDIGAYGDDDHDRTRLVDIARTRAAEKHGHPIPQDRVVIIGDTPHDVAAAKAVGAHAIAVTTGRFTAEDLADAALVLPDLAIAANAARAYLRQIANSFQ